MREGKPLPIIHHWPGLSPYAETLAAMEGAASALAERRGPEQIWFLEHPALYTTGSSAKPEEVLRHDLPVHAVGRGGHTTYHGPGQRVLYLMLDLNARGRDIRRYVAMLEDWCRAALGRLGVQADTRTGRVGLWVVQPDGAEAKIAAIGVRVRRWVTLHGMAINVNPDLAHFAGIIPCGIREHGVTSLSALAPGLSMVDLDEALLATLPAALDRLGYSAAAEA